MKIPLNSIAERELIEPGEKGKKKKRERVIFPGRGEKKQEKKRASREKKGRSALRKRRGEENNSLGGKAK